MLVLNELLAAECSICEQPKKVRETVVTQLSYPNDELLIFQCKECLEKTLKLLEEE